MHQARLNDAAIALSQVLDKSSITFGIFGGYAIAAHGGQRESKDIDCLAAVTKQQILDLLDGKQGFVAVPQAREDYVAFLWSDKPNRQNAVLVEIFCENFPGARHSMGSIHTNAVPISGQALGDGTCSFLDPFHLFKGKLRAAATRAKFHDSADLRWLETRYSQAIQASRQELNLQYVGLALKRYPELELLFTRIGIDINVAKNAAINLDPNNLPRPAPGDVQEGLLA